jgi:hypothetical protein
MVNLTYLVHVGCHLDRHIITQAGADVKLGADAMARTGCRARTLWATTGRPARAGRTDGRGRHWRKRVCRRGRQWQVRVCRRGPSDVSGGYWYVGADATAGIVMRART